MPTQTSVMQTQTNNVFLQITETNGTHKIPCGNWSLENMNNMADTVRDTKLTKDCCLVGISANINRTTRNSKVDKMPLFGDTKWVLPRETIELVIDINPDCVDKPCGCTSRVDCANCIASGQCTDEFVINLIGKKLFTEKYQGK